MIRLLTRTATLVGFLALADAHADESTVNQDSAAAVETPSSAGTSKEVPMMPSSWTGLGTSLAVDTEIFTSAPYALKLTPATGSYSYVISERAEIRPGTDYVVSAWVRTEGNDEYTDFLPIRWFNGSSFMQQSGPVAPGDDPEWSAISQTVTAPDEATHADVAFFMQSQQGAVWIDDVSLKADGADEELLTNPSFDQ